MRIFVEKLAKAIEDRGLYTVVPSAYAFVPMIKVDDIGCDMIGKWDNENAKLYVYQNYELGTRCTSIKLYNDEEDLMKEAFKKCKTKSRDYFIEKLSNLK